MFAELPKFDRGETDLPTLLDKWFYFLKHADDLRMVPTALESDPAIRHALAIANRAGMTPEELDAQEKREMFIQDQRGALTKALAQGKAEGIVEGIEKGMEKGMEKGKKDASIAIARELLDLLDAETISKKTGLSVAEIQALS